MEWGWLPLTNRRDRAVKREQSFSRSERGRILKRGIFMGNNEMYLQQAELYIDNINYMLAQRGRRYSYSIRFDANGCTYSIACGKIHFVSEGLRSMRYKDVIIYNLSPNMLYTIVKKLYNDLVKSMDAQDN